MLHIKIERIELPVGEFTLEADAESRGVRLDVYVRDNGGLRAFDLEMQISNKHNLPSTDFTDEICRQMHYARQNVQYRQGYMTLARLRAEDRNEGIAIGEARGIAIGEERGSHAAKLEAARNFLRMGLSPEKVAEGTGLTLEEISQI